MRFLAPAFVAATFCAAPTHAAIYRVGSGAGCTHSTIQSAIDAAVASAADDEIHLGASAYPDQALQILGAEGRLALIGGYADCAAAEPTGGARTMLGGTSTQSVVRISASADVRLWHLDIQAGHATDFGGGVRFTTVTAASLDLLDTLVRNNEARAGGGIAIENGNPDVTAEQVRLSLRGDSNVLGNVARNEGGTTFGGGGIHCTRASVQIADSSHVSQNRTETHGGGIHADDCRIEIGSRGIGGAVLWANHASANGGGLFARGPLATIDIYTVDPTQPARVVGNSAYYGSALQLRDGANARLFDVNIEANTGSVRGVVYVDTVADAPAPESIFVMRGGIDGAPAGAVACAEPEACNRIAGNTAPYGWVSVIDLRGRSAQAGSATAFLLGTRIEGNTGADQMLRIAPGILVAEGMLVVGNTADALIGEAEGTLTIADSTITGNTFRPGTAVVQARGDCDEGTDGGTRIERSIIWQPGLSLIAADPGHPLQTDCFTHLVGNDFGALPAAGDRIVADPWFVDPGTGNYHLSPASPALDFAPADEYGTTRDRGPRVFDLPGSPNRFGPQDLGAYERVLDAIFDSGFEFPERP